ncbi:MAG: hypothetical protein WAN33_04655 [Candidatus Acidiferrales bacterium]
MARGDSWFSSSNMIYLLLHLVLVLVGILLASRGGALAISAGASLIATGITGWVLFAHMRLNESQRSLISLLTLFGFVKVFDARAVRIKSEYDARLDKARDRIDILGFGLRALREDYREEFAKWKEKANVRILLIDPEFPNLQSSYANQRDKEEKSSEGTIRADVEAFLVEKRRLDNMQGEHSFDVRLYTCLPLINIFRIDDELFWGPYLIGKQSRNAPTFLVRRGGVLFERFVDHFERVWNEPELSHPATGLEQTKAG